MYINKIMKLNMKSNKGFTMQDLIIAIFILTILAGFISGIMYSVYATNVKSILTAQMTTYAVEMLEDIDKISYEEVNSNLSEVYHEKFGLSDDFNVNIQVSNYGEGMQYVEDVIKIVNLTISYNALGNTEEFSVKRLKIKEM